jgi:NTE family protein
MQYNFKNLVFEGGGVKGIAYGGALAVLNDASILNGIQRVAGSSAGAISATLLALGYSPSDISAIIAETNFKDFEDGNLISEILGISKKFGWFKGDKFKAWIGKYIQDKTGKSTFTFGELAEQARAKGFRNLYVVATNLSEQRAEIFSHEHTPGVAIQDAVRMSMSIPLYFYTVLNGQSIMADGGTIWNYPISIFDDKKYIANPQNCTKAEYFDNPDYVVNYETLGFRIDSRNEMKYSKDNWATEPKKIGNLKEYAGAIINLLMEAANKTHLHQNDWNRTVFVDALDVKTTDFKLSASKIQDLIVSGKMCTSAYLKWRDGDAVWGVLPV